VIGDARGVVCNYSVAVDALPAALETGPPHGKLEVGPDGSLTYTPDPDFAGLDRFTYRASDGAAESEPAAVGVSVRPVNDPPVAGDDAFATDEDVTLVVDASGVLGNDSDIDGNALTVVDASQPANGTLAVNGDGSFTYTPAPDFHGEDGFAYTVADADGLTATADVVVTVISVNDAPVASDDTAATDEDNAVTLAADLLLGNDGDVDGDDLAIAAVEPATHGDVRLNEDGSVTYTPAPNFNGADSFQYRATDGAATSTAATVTVTVRPIGDAPVANGDTYEIDEDTQLVIASPGVLANDVDADGDALSALVITSPSRGSLALLANGSLLYLPLLNSNGSDSFTYAASDGSSTSPPTTVSIAVRPVADPPTALNDKTTTAVNSAKTINVLNNDSDPEGDAMQVIAYTQGAHGAVTIAANGSATYTPEMGYAGVDTFAYTVADATGLAATAAVAITVGSATPATVVITTFDQDTGAAVVNVGFDLYTDLGGGERGVWMGSAFDASGVGGNDGVTTFTGVAPGAYVLVNSLRPFGYPAAPDQTLTIPAGANVNVPIGYSSGTAFVSTAGVPALSAARSDVVGSAGERGEAPEVAPDVVGAFVTRFRLGVAVDPGRTPAEALGGADVVLEAEGDMEQTFGRLADARQRLLEDGVGGFVGAAVLGGDHVVERNADVLE
jgi:hypothetical protein